LPTVQADRVLAFTLQEFAAAMPQGETQGRISRQRRAARKIAPSLRLWSVGFSCG
jgi:hypothetical protein